MADGPCDLPSGTRLTALDETFRADPYPILARLRTHDPVHWDEQLKRWFVTDHRLVREVLRSKEFCVEARKASPESFARRIAEAGGESEPRPSMLGLDDPDHRRLRSFVSRAFSPGAMPTLRPKVVAVVERVLEPLKGRRAFDLIGEFAGPIPFLVLAGMLGVEPAHERDFKQWADAKVLMFDPFRSAAAAAAMEQADAGLNEYFRRVIERRRARPAEDLISDLVRANEGGERLSEEEIVTMCKLLIVAGIVTTTDLLGNGMLALLRHPAQCRKLRQNPALIGGAVEEMLRFDSPVIQTGRIAGRDIELAGRRLAKGDSISLSLGAANRDPAACPHAGKFDIERSDLSHQSFGGGVHLCLGAHLARLEAEVAIGALLQAFPALRLAPGEVVRKSLPVLHGCRQLMVQT